MRVHFAAIPFMTLLACTPEAPIETPVAAAPPAVPPGCAVDAASRVALGALAPQDLLSGAASLGLPASDIGRLAAVRSGTGSAADIAYVAGCLGVTL